MARRQCETGKVVYRSREEAKQHARHFIADLVQDGARVDPLYTYVCDACGRIHLTRRRLWDGRINLTAAVPPPVWLQEWARVG